MKEVQLKIILLNSALKAKELMMYGQLTLSQIAFDLEYNSVVHLSKHFKKMTGLTPTDFKEMGITRRTSWTIFKTKIGQRLPKVI
ncbi:MAG: helix-turn-helix domain-containing protein [Dyadobacter sp.]